MKLTHTIVDTRLNLVGFIAEGKPSEFGRTGDETIQDIVYTDNLLKTSFRNRQIAVVNGKLTPQNKFKYYNLPMVMIQSDKSLLEVDNTITLTRKVLSGNEKVGYECTLGGVTKLFTINSILVLSDWFRPTNFIPRTQNNGNMHLAGKNCSLDDLPALYIESKADKKEKNTSHKKEVQENSLLDLYNILENNDGLIIKLPEDNYTRTTQSSTITGKDFISLGVGDIGSPSIEFSSKYLNANTKFKCLGTVTGNVSGVNTTLQTFTWKQRSVFYNGENHMKRLGIAVNQNGLDLLLDTFGENIDIKTLEDTRLINSVSALTGIKDHRFFEVDVSKLVVMTKAEAQKRRLTDDHIYTLLIKLTKYKMWQKILNGYIKHMKESHPELNYNYGKEVYRQFRGMTQQALRDINGLGVDVFTGAYTKSESIPYTGKDSTDTKIEVEYVLKGSNISKITYESALENIGNAEGLYVLVSKDVDDIIQMETQEGVNKALGFISTLKKDIKTIEYKLFLHRMSMFVLGGNRAIQLKDKSKWREVKAKTGKKYEHPLYGMGLKLKNIDIQ